MFYDQGPRVSFGQLRSFHQCSPTHPLYADKLDCSVFSPSAVTTRTASTVSLSILVVIEMFNAMNALSSSESLLTLPLWRNMKLIYAIGLSMALHFAILYTPFLQTLFSIEPLNATEWWAVVCVSIPVVLIDEVLKLAERMVFLSTAAGTTDNARLPAEQGNGFVANGKVKAS
jgi:Ca2+ transporting ATPase